MVLVEPAQIGDVAVNVATGAALTVTVSVFETTVALVTQARLLVKMQLTTSWLFNAVVLNVAELPLALLPFICHW